MTTEEALRKNIEKNDADPQHRLIYADWLDENDQPEEAARQRRVAGQPLLHVVYLTHHPALIDTYARLVPLVRIDTWTRDVWFEGSPCSSVRTRTIYEACHAPVVVVDGVRRDKINRGHGTNIFLNGVCLRRDYPDLDE